LRVASINEGQSAQTEIRYAHATSMNGSLHHIYTAHPITGRTHQIRVHAAASELPLLGDNFYGGESAPYLHLVSCELSLPHPLTGDRLEFELPARLAPAWVHAV